MGSIRISKQSLEREQADAERRAIEKLIREVDSAEKLRNVVPRRIFMLFAAVVCLSLVLLVFSLKFRRRDRPIQPTPP